MTDAPGDFVLGDLARARILVTNDDGINAEGLAALEAVARQVTDDVVVCAPEQEQSGAGHSLTIHRPLRLREVAANRFAIDGTPTDCVLVAINHIFADERPTLVLSGINHGPNMAEDVTYSGTVAAAMEATLLGVPAMAVSMALAAGTVCDWEAPRRYIPAILERICQGGWPAEVLMNVNFPARPGRDVTGLQVVPQGRQKKGDTIHERVDPRGRRYFWIGEANSLVDQEQACDVTAVADGAVSLTPIHLDMTHQATLARLHDVFGRHT